MTSILVTRKFGVTKIGKLTSFGHEIALPPPQALFVEGQKTAVENLIGALANAAKAEDVAKISALTKEIQQAIVNVEESKVSKNAIGPLRNEFETAITQLQKTVNDIAESAKSSDAKFTTELAALSSVLESLQNAPESKTEP